jgi:hypothetical protein
MARRKSLVEIELEKEWEHLLGTLGESAPAASIPQAAFRSVRGAALFAELGDVRLVISEVASMPGFERASNRYVNAEWTVKDQIGHAAAWAAETRREIETVARGAEFDYAIPFAFSVVGPTAWNQVEVERRRSRPLNAVLAELDQEIRTLQDIVIDLPEGTLNRRTLFPLAPSGDHSERLRATPGSIVLGQCVHLRSHIARLTAALPRLTAPGR